MPELEVLQVLQAGGDLGIWVLVAVFWKQDRRILALELLGENLKKWAAYGPHFREPPHQNHAESCVLHGTKHNRN